MPELARMTVWVNILERDGWILVNIRGKKLGILISMTEGGKEYLRVAGYHAGETRWVGERQNVLSVKVEEIPEAGRDALLLLVRNALPVELRDLPISFL